MAVNGYMTAKEAAEYAGISRPTLYKWCDDGLRHFTRGTGPRARLFFKRGDIDSYINSVMVEVNGK